MKSFLALLALISFGLFAQQTHATLINGAIGFTGTVELNTASAGTATQVTAWHYTGTTGSPLVNAADGDFLGTLGTFATFTAPWTFTSGLSPLWTVGGFTFDLLTSAIVTQGFDVHGMGYVTVSGTGIVSHAGFDNTFGTWNFTTQDPSSGGQQPVFSFSAAGQATPDGGSTVALLGLTLAGIEGLRRKLRKV